MCHGPRNLMGTRRHSLLCFLGKHSKRLFAFCETLRELPELMTHSIIMRSKFVHFDGNQPSIQVFRGVGVGSIGYSPEALDCVTAIKILPHVASDTAFLGIMDRMGVDTPRARHTPWVSRLRSTYSSPSVSRLAVSAVLTRATSSSDKRFMMPSRSSYVSR